MKASGEASFVTRLPRCFRAPACLQLPTAVCLLPTNFLEVPLAGVVAAVAVDLDGVRGALAVDATVLLALLDGAGAGGVPAAVGGFHLGVSYVLIGHLRFSSGCPVVEKMPSVLCQIARRVKDKGLPAVGYKFFLRKLTIFQASR